MKKTTLLTHPWVRAASALLALLFIGTQAQAQFITVWKTTQANEQIVIPTFPGETYRYTVHWGVGEVADGTNHTTDASHTYAKAGSHTVKITGTFPRIYFAKTGGHASKITAVQQWGAQKWTSMEGAFARCTQLQMTATDTPDLSKVESMAMMFAGNTALTGHANMNGWDVTHVKDMRGLFYQGHNFNAALDKWNTHQVKDMSYMFFQASIFNQPIGSWNTAQVTSMGSMFFQASIFNQPIGSWNTAQVTNMSSMFFQASKFNQPIGSWNTAQVKDMSFMFSQAKAMQKSLASWNTAQVKDMSFMFSETIAAVFANVVGWDVSQVTNMSFMFNAVGTASLDKWNVSNVRNMSEMGSILGIPTLRAWAALPSLRKGVKLGFGFSSSSEYCESDANKLKKTYGWVISRGQSISSPGDFVVTQPPSICSGGSLDLATVVPSGTTDLTYWKKTAYGDVSEPVTAQSGAFTVSPTRTTTYYIKRTHTANDCILVKPVVVTISTQPTTLRVEAAKPTTAASSSSVTFNLFHAQAGDQIKYQLTGGTASGLATIPALATSVAVAVKPNTAAKQVTLTLTSLTRGTCDFSNLSSLAAKTASMTVPNPPSTMGMEVATAYDLAIYPVPVRDRLNIRIAQAANGRVRLILRDLSGQAVARWTATKHLKAWENTLDMSQVSPGAYLLEIALNDQRWSRKVVKQ